MTECGGSAFPRTIPHTEKHAGFEVQMLSMPAFVTKSHKACTDPGRLTHESEFKLLDITSEVTHPSLTTRHSLCHT